MKSSNLPAVVVGLVVAGVLGVTMALAQTPATDGGVKLGNPSFVRKLISAEKVEQVGSQQYLQLTQKAGAQGALLGPSHPTVQRVRKIADELLPYSYKFNERAKEWKWEVNVFRSPAINAFCMPGGKIAFFTGIIDQLKLTDDEIAMVMGHEIAHALREHARERMAKQRITQFGAIAVSLLVGGNAGEIARVGGGLLGLKFSRDDETEGDLIGMELAARAGYDPRAGVTLWEKMSAASKGAPPQWMSTHPSGKSRIEVIEKNLKDVMPLYEAAKGKRGQPGPR